MMLIKKLSILFMFSLTTAGIYAQNHAIPIEAEDANSIGSDFENLTEGDITFLTPKTDFASATNPGTSDKILTFQVTFAAAGTYNLYIKLRVGPNGANDDSFYFGRDFGTKQVNTDSDWSRINNIGNGSAEPNSYVLLPEENSIGDGIFKWINASRTAEEGQILFVVNEESLTQTFQLGSRENGLDLDKIAFGKDGLFYTVSNLENGEAGVTEIPDLDNTLIVNLSSPIRPATHCASGALYGVTEDVPSNITDLVAPLKPYVYVQPARSGAAYQQATMAAAIPISERLASTTGQIMIRLPDICPGWPYQWMEWENWSKEVKSVINEKKASGRNNYYGYEIWNERHGTWQESNGDFYTKLWKPTYDLIRSLDPDAKIIGPSDSYYKRSRIEEFLTFCKNNSCIPDIMCWHELQGSENITSHVSDYRALEKSLGIPEIPISINEYCHSNKPYEGSPGVSAPFIAKFERNKVHSASISWWFTELPGRLGSLLTASNEKGGGWWFYKWYGDMTGNMVSVTPPNDGSDGIDGFACLDEEVKYASICLGGNFTGTIDILIKGIPSSFGETVYAKVEYVSWTNKDTPVSGTTIISTTEYPVSGGTISVPVTITNPLYGYRVYITAEEPVDPITSAHENESSNISIYPNPVSDFLTISRTGSKEEVGQLFIYELNGRLIKVVEVSNDDIVPLSDLPQGMYILKLDYQNDVIIKKIIKK